MSEMKSLSFIDRTTNRKCVVQHETCVPNVQRYNIVNKQELDPKLNRIVTRTAFEEQKKSKLRNFRVTDFSIENLTSIGAVGSLKHVCLHHSPAEQMTIIENQIANLKIE